MCPQDGFCPVRRPEPGENVRPVAPDRVRADDQDTGNIGIGLALCDKPEDFQFPYRPARLPNRDTRSRECNYRRRRGGKASPPSSALASCSMSNGLGIAAEN